MATSNWFGRMFKKKPATSMELYKSGMQKAEAGDPEGAIEDYTAAISMEGVTDEERAMALYNRAAVFHSMQRNEEAIKDLDAVLAMKGISKRVAAAALSKRERIMRRTGQA